MIPVASPDIGPLEEQYVLEAVRSGWVSSMGKFVDRFEQDFAKYCGGEHGVAMSNGTGALFIALKALGVGPGDEVIVPSLTFVAVPAVVTHLGAEPVIVDVHPDYWCLDPVAVERAVSKKTKAIVAVHVYGHPADMDALLSIARPHGIAVVEDAAEAHGAKYRGKRVGALGDVGVFSFYGNKIITTGEGGMAVTDDGDLAARMRFLKDHAMDSKRRYFHPEVGFNRRMTNIQAALGCAQLERIDELQRKRSCLLDSYREQLDGAGVSLNPVMAWAEPVNWMVCAVLEGADTSRRAELLFQLKQSGIDTRPFFLPAQMMPSYANCRVVGAAGDARTPCSDALADNGFNLPSSPSLDRDSVTQVVTHLRRLLSN